MVPYFGIIVSSYLLAVVFVHVSHGYYLRKKPRDRRTHYVLITRNHGSQLEWYLMSLAWYSLWRGVPLRVTVLDDGSQDDTKAIMKCWKINKGMELAVMEWAAAWEGNIVEQMQAISAGEETLICVDLRNPQEANKIPYVHV